MTRTPVRPMLLAGTSLVAALAIATSAATTGTASVEPGTPAKDVHLGLDDDNALNAFIQPPGVAAPQHMDDTDLLFGRGNADLLVGNKGGDTLLGGPGPDILVGGPDRGSTGNRNDVVVGDDGDDVEIWSPGDGNDILDGDDGTDTVIVGAAITDPDGSLRLDTHSLNRTIPRVRVDGFPTYACTLIPVPPGDHLGYPYLLRFSVEGVVENTLRLKEIEQVVCPGPSAGTAMVADLTGATGGGPAFRTVPLTALTGPTRAIVAPVRGWTP